MTDSNKRSYYRVNDKVALIARKIEPGRVSPNELFERRIRETGISNRFIHERAKKRPSLLSIERRYPEVASYIEYLEDKIQALASYTSSDQSPLPMTPDHDVSLSASGLSFNSRADYAVGDQLEITMRLFPSRMVVYVIATVTRREPVGGKGLWEIGVKYTHIHEDDREQLFQQVNHVQTDSLKVVVN
ncbi:MAG TPA: PilZ domain-containing protein [Gammaproteobacteria bacterium]|nr:PilZ domain-containing protein [Gammaproteobacteria bacterium]